MRSLFTSCLRYSLITLSLWLPILASAQAMPLSHWTAMVSGRLLATGNSISVTASTAFPSEIAASDSATAIYTVTNIGTITWTGISTQLAAPSAFSISSTTCGETSPLAVGDSCTVSLTVQAPSDATTLSGTLQERALPSIDGVKVDFSVHVNAPLTVTPSAGSNGVISPSTVQTINYGSDVAFTATPDAGYSISQWTVDGSVVPSYTGTTYTFNDVTTNHSISVSFATSQLTVTSAADGHGSVTPASRTVAYGGSAEFSATPDAHYHIEDWLIDDVSQSTNSTSFTSTNVTTDQRVTALFAIDHYTVTSVSGSNGSVSPLTQIVDYGGSATSTASPNTGYQVLDWAVDGVPQGTTTTTFILSNITEHHTVAVTFTPLTYVVTSSSTDITKGNVGPSSRTVDYGASATFTAVPEPNYSVNQWLVDGVLVQTGGTSYALTDVTATHAVTVSFYVPLMVAVGEGFSGPKLVQSLDKGVTWVEKSIGSFVDGTLYDTSCTGTESTAVCTAAGIGDPDGSDLFPLLAVTRDNGVTWNQATIPVFPENAQLNTTSCTGSGSTAFCLAAGHHTLADPTVTPILVKSVDGGVSWSSVSIPGITLSGTLTDSSCTGTGVNNVCTIIGKDIAVSRPLLVVGTADGTSWSVAADITVFTSVTLNTTSCTGSGSSAVCVAAGKDSSAPFIAVSTNGGTTWSRQIISGLPATGEFKASSCTGSGTNVICSVAGVDNSNSKAMLWVLNASSGVPAWTAPTLSGSSNVTLITTSCTGSGSTALCTAAGETQDASLTGVLIQSSNGGSTWTSSTITGGMPVAPDFRGSHCSVNQAICTTVGNYLLQTITAGSVWTQVSGLGTMTIYASSGT